MSAQSRMAHALCRELLHTLRVASDQAPAAVAALDPFLAGPRAATFVTSVRLLREVRARGHTRALETGSAERGLRDGLRLMASVPGMGPGLLAVLRTLAPEPGCRDRLTALWGLATARQELLARATAMDTQRRARLTALTGNRPVRTVRGRAAPAS